jgi:uncharacterized protein (DUF697 family)/predicted GTPase
MFERLQSLLTTRWLSESEFQRQFSELIRRQSVPEFWLLGKTGSGKSSVIRFLTGAEQAEVGNGFRPQTRHSQTFDFPSPDAPLLRFIDTRGLGESGYDAAAEVAAFSARSHVVIVTARLLDQALGELLETLRAVRTDRPSRPVLLAITCLHEAYPRQPHPQPDPFVDGSWSMVAPDTVRRAYATQVERFADLVDRIVPIDFTLPEDDLNPTDLGGQRLHAALVELLPAAYRQTLLILNDARRDLSDLRMRRAAPYIAGYSLAAASAAAVPVPWIDLPLVLGIQSHLLLQLARLYGQPASATQLWKIAGPIAGSLLTRFAAREILKSIPLLGMAANATLAYAYTFGLGRLSCWYFDRVHEGHLPTADEVKQVWEQEIAAASRRWQSSQQETTA